MCILITFFVVLSEAALHNMSRYWHEHELLPILSECAELHSMQRWKKNGTILRNINKTTYS